MGNMMCYVAPVMMLVLFMQSTGFWSNAAISDGSHASGSHFYAIIQHSLC